MVTQPTDDSRGAPIQAVAKRPWWSRVSTGQLVMVVAFIAAFLLNLNLLRSRDAVSLVAVATSELVPGQVFDTGDVEFIEIDASNPMLTSLITDEQADRLEGKILLTRVTAGAPVSRSFLGDAAAEGALRSMSIPVDPAHAVGGDLIVAGDTVDVIAVDDGVARYVVVGAQVLDVDDGSNVGALAGTDRFSIVVAVDDTTALAIAEALQSDSIEVIRATGAPTPELLTLPGDADASADGAGDAATGQSTPTATSVPPEGPSETTGS